MLLDRHLLIRSVATTLVLAVALWCNCCCAQETEADTSQSAAPVVDTSLEGLSTQEQFEKTLKACKKAIVGSHVAAMNFYDKGIEEADEREKTWLAAKAEVGRQAKLLKQTGIALFLETESPSEELIGLMLQIQPELMISDDRELTLSILEKLRRVVSTTGAEEKVAALKLQRDEAMVALKLNKFDRANEYIKLGRLEINEELEDQDKGLLILAETFAQTFAEELKIREQEAQADDLPRVKIETVHGDIIVELFENEAPETVANFIYLVELKFFDGTYFHRVMHDFMAQGGGFTKRGPRECGWFIKDEVRQPNARRHFRGSLSMANMSKPNSGSNQFFITTIPTPLLDWNGEEDDPSAHTVFGRVISGMEFVDKLTKTIEFDEEEMKDVLIKESIPDEIIRMTVLRKRDHEYEPNRIMEQPQ